VKDLCACKNRAKRVGNRQAAARGETSYTGPMIFLTGGTGLVGARLASRLAERGEPVRCLVRDPRRARALSDLGFELVTGDLRAPERFRGALTGCTAVVHLASALGAGAAHMDAVNRGGTEALVEMAQEAGAKRLIHVSSHGARPNPRLPYAYSEWGAEQAVAASALDWLVLRPTVVLGRGDPFSGGLVRMLRRWPALVLPDGGRLRVQPVWVEDVVRCVLSGLGESAPARRRVPVAGGEVLSRGTHGGSPGPQTARLAPARGPQGAGARRAPARAFAPVGRGPPARPRPRPDTGRVRVLSGRLRVCPGSDRPRLERVGR